jgi:nucleoside-diphosphate-sugar epimerase
MSRNAPTSEGRKKRIVVTGGSGELGTVLLRRLAADPSVGEIVSIDVRPPVASSPKLRAVACDVRDAAVEGHLAGADAVAHLAFVLTQLRPRAEMDAFNV